MGTCTMTHLIHHSQKVNVIINIIDEEKPCLFEEENNDTYISVNMPMRI